MSTTIQFRTATPAPKPTPLAVGGSAALTARCGGFRAGTPVTVLAIGDLHAVVEPRTPYRRPITVPRVALRPIVAPDEQLVRCINAMRRMDEIHGAAKRMSA